jgi:hypothetical protein
MPRALFTNCHKIHYLVVFLVENRRLIAPVAKKPQPKIHMTVVTATPFIG